MSIFGKNRLKKNSRNTMGHAFDLMTKYRYIDPEDVGELFFHSDKMKTGSQPGAIAIDEDIYKYYKGSNTIVPISVISRLDKRTDTPNIVERMLAITTDAPQQFGLRAPIADVCATLKEHYNTDFCEKLNHTFEYLERHSPYLRTDVLETLCILVKPAFALKYYMKYCDNWSSRPYSILEVLDLFWLPFTVEQIRTLMPIADEMMRNAKHLTVEETNKILENDPDPETTRILMQPN